MLGTMVKIRECVVVCVYDVCVSHAVGWGKFVAKRTKVLHFLWVTFCCSLRVKVDTVFASEI